MEKTLADYLAALGPLALDAGAADPGQLIRGVANNSRKVRDGFLFCAQRPSFYGWHVIVHPSFPQWRDAPFSERSAHMRRTIE